MTLKKPPIHPPIEAGESPLFYLKRLALLNHYDSHTWLYKNAEDRVSRNLSQLVEYLTEEDWTKQAEQDEAALRIFQLENFHLVKKARFCPICISEDKIWRATWHLKTSVTCVKHEVNLVDVCPTCCADTDLFKAKLHECVCGAPYGEQSTVRASKQLLELQLFIEDGAVPEQNREQLMPADHELTLEERVSLVSLFSRLTPNHDVKKTGTSTKLNSMQQALDALQDVARGLLGGKAMFIALLGVLQKMGGKGHKVDQLTIFYRSFYKEAKKACFQRYKDVLEAEITKRSVYATKRNSLFSEETINGNVWLPLKVASKEYSVAVSKLRLATKEGLIACDRQKKGGRTFSLIYRPHLETRLSFLLEQLNATEAAILLGVTKSQMQLMCNSGVFLSAVPPEPGRCSHWRIAKSEIVEYLKSLTPKKVKLMPKSILLPVAMKKYGGDIPNLFLTILQECRVGNLLSYLDDEALGIRGLVLCHRDLISLIKRITPDHHISATRMAGKLQLHPEFMSQLVKHKLIKSYETDNNSDERVIPLEFAHKFKTRFVIGAKLANVLEMSPRDLYRHLAELGIMPFDHDKNYKLRSKLYQRYQFVDAPMIYAYVRNLLDWNDVSF